MGMRANHIPISIIQIKKYSSLVAATFTNRLRRRFYSGQKSPLRKMPERALP